MIDILAIAVIIKLLFWVTSKDAKNCKEFRHLIIHTNELHFPMFQTGLEEESCLHTVIETTISQCLRDCSKYINDIAEINIEKLVRTCQFLLSYNCKFDKTSFEKKDP